MSFGYFSRKVLAALATLAFVVCFNFFLFRVVESDPVATLFRGRNLTPTQRLELRREFGLDGSKREQFVRYLQQTAQLNFGRSYRSNQPVASEIVERAWPTIALVGVGIDAPFQTYTTMSFRPVAPAPISRRPDARALPRRCVALPRALR